MLLIIGLHSDEEIKIHNDKIFEETMHDGQPAGLINPRFRFFDGAEDC